MNIFNNGTTNLSTVTAEKNGENGISVVNSSGNDINNTGGVPDVDIHS